tara:strand:- start:434 stop:1015 length:582 start_codon:yes stop_codon:yes gene_type:complete
MKSNIDIEKDNQRKIAIKKRLLINKSINNKKLYFDKNLEKINWFNKGKIVASFFSIRSEIPTSSLNQYIFDKNKILCFPVIDKKNDEILIFRKYTKGDELISGKFGIKVPSKGYQCLPDIIFTPCLAYDFDGFRLGYGGGYYDKTFFYLNSIKHKFIIVGLAYDDQRIDKVANNHLDQKLNYILTEKKLYKIL